MADSFRNEVCDCLYEWVIESDLFKNARSFINETNCLNGDAQLLSCDLICNYLRWPLRNRAKSGNSVVVRQCKSLNMNFLFNPNGTAVSPAIPTRFF